jgi:cytoplasmic tRNA 2-thiolation protein 1
MRIIKKLDYFSTECTYSPEAFRGTARTLIKNLEAVRPSSIIDIIRSGESFILKRNLQTNKDQKDDATQEKQPKPAPLFTTETKLKGRCERCGYLSNNKLCKACVLLEGLNASRAKITIDGSKDIKGEALLTKQLEKLSF